MKAEGISFRHAVELLRSQGTESSPLPMTNARVVKYSRTTKLAVPLSAEAPREIGDVAALVAFRSLVTQIGNPC